MMSFDFCARRATRTPFLPMRWMVLAFLALTALVVARPARPCTCSPLSGGAFPTEDGVIGGGSEPTNGRIYLESVDPFVEESIELTSVDDGATVAFDTFPVLVDGRRFVGIQPITALRARTDYVARTIVDVSGSPFELEERFTTGDGPDESVPQVPVITSLTVDVFGHGAAFLANLRRQSMCGPVGTSVRATISTEPDDEARVVVVQRESSLGAFDVARATGEVMAADTSTLTLAWSDAACGGGNWQDAAPGSTETFFIGAIGPNGRFSGWSAPIHVVIPWVTMWSCAAAHLRVDERPALGLSAIAIALMVLARRRPRPARRSRY